MHRKKAVITTLSFQVCTLCYSVLKVTAGFYSVVEKISEYDIIKGSWLVPETKSLNSTSGTIKGNTQFSNACISEQKGN
jgi:hypothetical protein